MLLAFQCEWCLECRPSFELKINRKSSQAIKSAEGPSGAFNPSVMTAETSTQVVVQPDSRDMPARTFASSLFALIYLTVSFLFQQKQLHSTKLEFVVSRGWRPLSDCPRNLMAVTEKDVMSGMPSFREWNT